MKNPTYDTKAEYDAAIDLHTERLQFLSVGSCPGCPECGEFVDEEHFSWSSCNLCGSPLGGTRYPCHAYIAETPEAAQAMPREDIWHGECCVDCLMYLANGDLPEHMREE